MEWSHINHRIKISKNFGIVSHTRKKTYIRLFWLVCVLQWYTRILNSAINSVRGIHRSTTFNRLYLLQKKAVRITTFSHRTCHTVRLFNKLKILPFHYFCWMIYVLVFYVPKSTIKHLVISVVCLIKMLIIISFTWDTKYKDIVHITGCRLTFINKLSVFLVPNYRI